jgi:hypothetical protein
MKTTTYGRRGGEGPTAGKTAETIEATFFPGCTRSKRVFGGQRALTLIADEQGELVQAWADLAAAQAYIARTDRDRYPAQLAAAATPLPQGANR